MEYKIPPKVEFFPKCERVEPIVLDSSAYLEAKKCFRLFFYKIVLGYRPKNSDVHLNWGSAYHKFREILDVEYLRKQRAGVSDKMVLVADCFQPAMVEALKLWEALQPRDPNPEEYFGFMTKNRLYETLMFAYKYWIREKQLGITEVIATEQLFSVELAPGLWRSGKADRIIRRDGHIWGMDFKTSTKDKEQFAKTLDPNDQFSGYTIAEAALSGEVVKGQIVEVMYNKKFHKTNRGKSETGPAIWEFDAQRTPEQIEQWLKEQKTWDKFLEICRQDDSWPMADNPLVNCQFCSYKKPCSLSNNGAAEYNLRNFYDFKPHDHTKFGEASEG